MTQTLRELFLVLGPFAIAIVVTFVWSEYFREKGK